MNDWESGFRHGVEILAAVREAALGTGMVKALIRPEIERRLKRTMTDLDWQVFLDEVAKKASFEAQEKARQWLETQTGDRKNIHDLVWGINPESAE
jgi:hypothetical protein